MHGRKRAEYKHRFQDAQLAQGLAQKAQQWNALSAKALELRAILDNTTTNATSASTTSSGGGDDSNSAKDTKTLELLDKMLRVNPDPLHLWNHRRLLLLSNSMKGTPTSSSAESASSASASASSVVVWLDAELGLTAAALERNPKAYGAWFHRKWSLQQAALSSSSSSLDITTMTTVLQAELGLTELFLQRDERNFHCWNYRRFLVGLELEVLLLLLHNKSKGMAGLDGSWGSIMAATTNKNDAVVIGPQILPPNKTKPPSISTPETDNDSHQTTHEILQREWNFTHIKIVENFSNFSAFHYRSKLLLLVNFDSVNNNDEGSTGRNWIPSLDDNNNISSSSTLQHLAQQEWSLMENIMFTEPDDQTIWWYHRFMLDWVRTQIHGKEEWYTTWLHQQAETLQVLVEEGNDDDGDDSQVCKWALLGYHLVLTHLVAAANTSDHDDMVEEWNSKKESVLNQLIQVDPDRKERYETMRQQPRS